MFTRSHVGTKESAYSNVPGIICCAKSTGMNLLWQDKSGLTPYIKKEPSRSTVANNSD